MLLLLSDSSLLVADGKSRTYALQEQVCAFLPQYGLRCRSHGLMTNSGGEGGLEYYFQSQES